MFTTVCARYQRLGMSIHRVLVELAAHLPDSGEIQAINAPGPSTDSVVNLS